METGLIERMVHSWCCAYGSCTIVGLSQCLLCSLTMLTKSKLFLIGLSGLGQQVVLYCRTSNTYSF